MVFSSVAFLGIFLPVTLIAYFVFKNRIYRNAVLLIASLLFYSWGEPVYIVSMIFVTLIDYFFGLWIGSASHTHHKKLLLALCVVLNLIPLFLFKYYNFVSSELGALINVQFRQISAAMPIGISFFTFQSMSYAVDIYRGNAQIQKKYSKVLLYVSMFPQLIAGPIVRYSDVSKALDSRVETPEGFSYGMFRFSIGLAKKVVLANYAGEIATYLMTDKLGSLSVCGAWIGIITATFQLYFDFSGYSDMAIGLGHVFGFDFKENFRYPYIARSITEFWKRWHISMSNWFRDYVMYPIALSKSFAKLGKKTRSGFGPKASNLIMFILSTFITFSLIGLWHGADWNFLLWGLYYAMFLSIEKILLAKKIDIGKIPVISNLIMLFIVLNGFVLFYYVDLTDAGTFFTSLYSTVQNGFLPDLREISAICEIFWLLPVLILASTPFPAKLAKKIFKAKKAKYVAQSAFSIALIVISFILLLGQSYNAFLYFRF